MSTEAAIYARLSDRNTKWIAKLAEKSGRSKRDVLDLLVNWAREQGFEPPVKPVPDYLQKGLARYLKRKSG